MLEFEEPEVYCQFKDHMFVVKSEAGSFNAVAPDVKLEQIIQHSKRALGDAIGHLPLSGSLCTMKFWSLAIHLQT